VTIKRILLLPALGVALVAAGCGDDEENNEPAASSTPAQTTQTTQPQDPVKPAPEEAPAAGGEDAVKETIITWTFEGDCDTMTDKFLEEQAFVGDNRTERCKYFEDSFQKPQYEESDVKFRKVTVTGNKAVATVGSDISNVESDYHLVSEGGSWKIDEVDLG
jgi:hypothetical protein